MQIDGRPCHPRWQTLSGYTASMADHVTHNIDGRACQGTQDVDGRPCQGTQDVDGRPCQGTQGEDGRLYQDVDRWQTLSRYTR